MKHQHPTDPNLFWCPKCESWTTIGDFHKHKGRKDGLTENCKTCNCQHLREYHLKNKEKIKAKRKSYFDGRKEEKRIYDKKYRTDNKEQKRKTDEAWRKSHMDRVNELSRANNHRHWDKCLAKCRKSNERLIPSVIRGNIWKGLHIRNPSEELMEVFRQRIIMKRTLKQFKKWRKDYESNHTNVYGEQFKNEEDHERRLQTRSDFNSTTRV